MVDPTFHDDIARIDRALDDIAVKLRPSAPDCPNPVHARLWFENAGRLDTIREAVATDEPWRHDYAARMMRRALADVAIMAPLLTRSEAKAMEGGE